MFFICHDSRSARRRQSWRRVWASGFTGLSPAKFVHQPRAHGFEDVHVPAPITICMRYDARKTHERATVILGPLSSQSILACVGHWLAVGWFDVLPSLTPFTAKKFYDRAPCYGQAASDAERFAFFLPGWPLEFMLRTNKAPRKFIHLPTGTGKRAPLGLPGVFCCFENLCATPGAHDASAAFAPLAQRPRAPGK